MTCICTYTDKEGVSGIRFEKKIKQHNNNTNNWSKRTSELVCLNDMSVREIFKRRLNVLHFACPNHLYAHIFA